MGCLQSCSHMDGESSANLAFDHPDPQSPVQQHSIKLQADWIICYHLGALDTEHSRSADLRQKTKDCFCRPFALTVNPSMAMQFGPYYYLLESLYCENWDLPNSWVLEGPQHQVAHCRAEEEPLAPSSPVSILCTKFDSASSKIKQAGRQAQKFLAAMSPTPLLRHAVQGSLPNKVLPFAASNSLWVMS